MVFDYDWERRLTRNWVEESGPEEYASRRREYPRNWRRFDPLQDWDDPYRTPVYRTRDRSYVGRDLDSDFERYNTYRGYEPRWSDQNEFDPTESRSNRPYSGWDYENRPRGYGEGRSFDRERPGTGGRYRSWSGYDREDEDLDYRREDRFRGSQAYDRRPGYYNRYRGGGGEDDWREQGMDTWQGRLQAAFDEDRESDRPDPWRDQWDWDDRDTGWDFDTQGRDRGVFNRSYNRQGDWQQEPGYRDWEQDWDFSYGVRGEPYDQQFTYRETYGDRQSVPTGPYTGMGPQGYKRSDDRIYEDVCERLSEQGQLDATNIELEVHDGEVTLNGSVPNRQDKWKAEDIITGVFGVREVHNRLKATESQQPRQQTTGRQAIRPEMRGRLRPGMQVVGLQGNEIGHVKEVGRFEFLVDRPFARDIFVPFSAIRKINGQVFLDVHGEDIGDQGWRRPSIF